MQHASYRMDWVLDCWDGLSLLVKDDVFAFLLVPKVHEATMFGLVLEGRWREPRQGSL